MSTYRTSSQVFFEIRLLTSLYTTSLKRSPRGYFLSSCQVFGTLTRSSLYRRGFLGAAPKRYTAFQHTIVAKTKYSIYRVFYLQYCLGIKVKQKSSYIYYGPRVQSTNQTISLLVVPYNYSSLQVQYYLSLSLIYVIGGYSLYTLLLLVCRS